MDAALADGLRRWRASRRGWRSADPVLQLTGVIPAAERALARAGLTLRDLDWIEINEAFACVVLAWLRATGANQSVSIPGAAPSRTAIRWARPARPDGKMLAGLRAIDGQFGMQLMCIGHGMATATILERL